MHDFHFEAFPVISPECMIAWLHECMIAFIQLIMTA